MYFESLSDFCYGWLRSICVGLICYYFLAMLALYVSSARRTRALLDEVKAKIDRQARIDAAKNMENTL